MDWLFFGLATPQFYVGASYYVNGFNLYTINPPIWMFCCHGHPAAYFYSIFVLFWRCARAWYFETSAVIITLVR